MTAWESVLDIEVEDEAELEEWLRETFAEFPHLSRERRGHDQDGYFAHDAGGAQCLALGHVPNENDEWDYQEGLHESGWDGETLCLATKFDTCCTACEGECQEGPPPVLWSLPGVRA